MCKTLLHLHIQKPQKMKNTTLNQSLSGAEKVLFKAHFNFNLQNGKTEAEATALAFDKIAKVRKMAKTLNFTH